MSWCGRTLIAGPYLALCCSEADFEKALKHLKVVEKVPFLGSETANASTHSLVNREGNLCCIVCLGSTEGKTPIQVAALLIHEAVHVWREFRAWIGEKEPSSEFEAYSIQYIAQELMLAYAKELR